MQCSRSEYKCESEVKREALKRFSDLFPSAIELQSPHATKLNQNIILIHATNDNLTTEATLYILNQLMFPKSHTAFKNISLKEKVIRISRQENLFQLRYNEVKNTAQT